MEILGFFIEPYYYPKKRDGIFKRTLCIAPENAVITATSTEEMTSKAVTFLIKDKKAINSFIEEYNSYLSICKPLMKIYTVRNKRQYFKSLIEFENELANSFVWSGSLSTVTIPNTVVNELIGEESSETKKEIIGLLRTRFQLFENLLKANTYTEIITIPDLNLIKDGKVHIIFSDFHNEKEYFYNANLYKLHLENIVRLLKEYKNYKVYINTSEKDDGYSLYIKEDFGAIVAKNSTPSVILTIKESNLNAAFLDHFNNKIDFKTYDDEKRKSVIKKLKQIINKLSKK